MWRSLVISWFVLMYWRSGIQAAEIRCNRPNEHYECGSSCQTTCAKLGTACPIVNNRCKDDCYCNENYARDANGTCIPEAQCPQNSTRTRRTRQVLQCNRPNEHYECGSSCQTTCATLGTACPIVNIRCKDDCYCNENYARDANGTCIPEAQCPPKSTRVATTRRRSCPSNSRRTGRSSK
ncbi:inducible metalloproteinase inhibitor protein-like [Spodoptera litura]|uniref:Inducible metalloproteinase inhibitor protein-like n=1 Tax=Spodoptera litura TaxID=69820 RepID=A0A9J7DTX2_SPOLT|nr:inducible metalloproteinase inhibitor protein-like [Spodoptera litura]